MLDLKVLSHGLPAVTPHFGQYLAEAGAVCFESQGHVCGASFFVQGHYSRSFSVLWPTVTQQMRQCLNDPEEATEFGATGVAILLVKKLADFSVVERSRKGTGFDYWLGDSNSVPFQNKARLEISGIRSGDPQRIKARVKQKLAQVDQSKKLCLPAYIVVVAFGKPMAEVEIK